MKTLLTVSLAFIVISCSDSSDNLLKDDQTIQSVFSETEIKDLQILLDFITGKICESENSSSATPAACFESYLIGQHKHAPSAGYVKTLCSLPELENLFTQISSETFGHIWIGSTSDYGTFLSINLEGKYVEFLNLVSEEEIAISEYKNHIVHASGIGAGAQANMILFPENFDTSDIRIRLIIAIHYLTVNYNSRE